MKLLTYYYHFIRKIVEDHCPTENAYLSALKTISFPISMVLSACLFQLIVQTEMLDVILNNWPYDYGRVHSKNFTTPTAILSMLCYLFSHLTLKKYFINQKIQLRLENYYKKETAAIREHRIIPELLTFFLIIFSLLIGFGVWTGVLICLMLLLGLELWIRNRFKQNRHKKKYP